MHEIKKLIHYVIGMADNHKFSSKKKLNKVLWFADALYYRNFGVGISELKSYKRWNKGPVVPNLDVILQELEKEGKIKVTPDSQPTEIKLLLKSDIDLNIQEADTLAEVFNFVSKETMTLELLTEISRTPSWDAAEHDSNLPLHTAFDCYSLPVTEEDKKWAMEEYNKYKQNAQ